MNQRQHGGGTTWGALLVALGILFLLQNLFGGGNLFGAMVVGAIGLVFLAVFYNDRRHWWAIIPGGIMITTALAILIGPWGWGEGSLHTIGLGLTFLAVWYFTGPDNQQHWAIWPGGILLVIGAIQLLGAIGVWHNLWPLLLIGSGVWLLTRRSRHWDQ